MEKVERALQEAGSMEGRAEWNAAREAAHVHSLGVRQDKSQ